ncbi:MAG: hypothetical protein WC666_01635 [Candidatus Paceibacterota bacterium]|jgi:ribulose-phosphate 3-epimerase
MTKKTEIIPAILPRDFNELEEKSELVKGFVKTVQVDICDGQFVPNASWPYKKQDNAFDKLIKEEEGLPGWKDLNYEFDLMVNNPSEVVDQWVSAGATRIIIHIEARGNIAEAIEKLQGCVEIGLALNIETPIESIEPYKEHINFIQCMGIDHIGFQGQEFDEKVIEKIKDIKKAYPDLPVSIDGGVSLETAPSLISAGADRLVIGSAIFNADNAFEAMQRFKGL